MENQCRFCKIAEHDICENYDHPFFESSDYFSIVTIGAMIKGWHLIVPKVHSCSMKDIYPKDSFISYINTELKLLWHDSNSIIAFEHGPNKEGSRTACGTNHAHMHLVPNCESLLDQMGNDGLSWSKCRPDEVSNKAGNNEYLYYLELQKDIAWESTIGYLCVLKNEVSQYFRRLIAQTVGSSEKYDYKQFLNLDCVQESEIYLKKMFSTINNLPEDSGFEL